jgi:hypothetical protein
MKRMMNMRNVKIIKSTYHTVIDGITVYNTTNHDINILVKDVMYCISPSTDTTKHLRLITTKNSINSFCKKVVNTLPDLPTPQNNTIYINSATFVMHCKREDFFYPHVNNSKIRIEGIEYTYCTSLNTY